MKARVEELKGLVENQRERKDEYAAIISQQSEGEWVFKYSGCSCLLLEVLSGIMLEKCAF